MDLEKDVYLKHRPAEPAPTAGGDAGASDLQEMSSEDRMPVRGMMDAVGPLPEGSGAPHSDMPRRSMD
jgi:hypothetical protein